MSEINLLFVLW